MSLDSTRQSGERSAAPQRFLSLFLRSEREIRSFSVAVDDFCQVSRALSSRALSSGDIRGLYSAGKPQPNLPGKVETETAASSPLSKTPATTS